MSNGKCSEAEDKILKDYDEFTETLTTEGKVHLLGEQHRDGRLDTVRGFAALYHRLPWRPWMIPVISGIGVLGIASLIWAASAFNKDVIANKRCADEALQTAEEAKSAVVEARTDFTQQLKPVSEASVAANAKLDMLLEARGMNGPSRSRIRRSAVALGLASDSTTNQDSTPPGP